MIKEIVQNVYTHTLTEKRVGEESESNIRMWATLRERLIVLQKNIFREAKKHLTKLNRNCIGNIYTLRSQSGHWSDAESVTMLP